jgi:peptidoglycan/xylan/chitin deacetylase (PgdA/CDA1 family)
MIILKKWIKARLSQLKFSLGQTLTIDKNYDPQDFIPHPYEAVFILQTDFELAWAWQYAKNTNNPVQKARNNAMEERYNVPLIIDLADKYSIPITWLTVGHLLLENCKKLDGKTHSKLPRLNHFKNEFWEFSYGDWFKNDPGTNYQKSPEWYCPDLIQKIINAKTNHEIGCHTFSHIDCRNSVCPPHTFRAEIEECAKAANKYGIKLKSFVHPAHTIGNLDTLESLGFTSFRTDYDNYLGKPINYKNHLWELKTSMPIYYRKEWSLNYHFFRYKKVVEKAIKNNALCVMWFHPSEDQKFIRNVLSKLFDYLNNQRDKVLITTTSNYIDWLNNKM